MTGDEIRLRPALPSDALCLAVLGGQLFLDTYATEGIRADLAREVLAQFSIAALEDLLANDAKRWVVAERLGHLIGFAQCTLNTTPDAWPGVRAACVDRLYVHRPFTGAGLGARLLRAMESVAAQQGQAGVWLTAWTGNARALRFYRRQGYDELGCADYVFEGVAYENLVFGKRLKAATAQENVGARPANALELVRETADRHHADRFYDDLSPLYHLVYQDWPASVRLQGQQLHRLLRQRSPGAAKVLDVACGIGTQALGLALQGWEVTASDLSAAAVERAQEEAKALGVSVRWRVGDMRQAHALHGQGFDAVICCDNSLPHLLTDAEIVQALQQMHACAAPGGTCVVSVRDYAKEPRGRGLVKPYGVRQLPGRRLLLFQVWDFEGDCYDLAFFFVEEDLATGAVHTRALRSRYYAIGTDRLVELMHEAGFADVQRLDGVFFQPLVIGTRWE